MHCLSVSLVTHTSDVHISRCQIRSTGASWCRARCRCRQRSVCLFYHQRRRTSCAAGSCAAHPKWKKCTKSARLYHSDVPSYITIQQYITLLAFSLQLIQLDVAQHCTAHICTSYTTSHSYIHLSFILYLYNSVTGQSFKKAFHSASYCAVKCFSLVLCVWAIKFELIWFDITMYELKYILHTLVFGSNILTPYMEICSSTLGIFSPSDFLICLWNWGKGGKNESIKLQSQQPEYESGTVLYN